MQEEKDIITEIHKVQLKILKATVAFFEKYNLRYSIYCGTLLGAVRHKGFIPWDDDIDLAMPLKDYRIFLEHADELPSGLSCVYRGNSWGFWGLWAKVAADGTTFMPVKFAKVERHWGMSIDIYPMIGVPKVHFLKKMQSTLLFFASKMQLASYYLFLDNPGCLRWIVAHIPFFVRKSIVDFILWFCLMDSDNSDYIGTIDAVPFKGKYKRNDWKEMTKLPFEGAYYTAPVQYDNILRRMYGNYMQLPPEEKRVGHFEENMIIDPHRDYRLYRKELLGK